MENEHRRWMIGSFEFDAQSQFLRQGRKERYLHPNEAKLLLLFIEKIENPGSAPHNDGDLIFRIWGPNGKGYSLYKSIQKLRDAFGGGREEYIARHPFRLVKIPKRMSSRFPGKNESVSTDHLQIPQARVKIWRVPVPLNRHLSGRDQTVKQIHKFLTRDREHIVVLHGLGGVGKTQIAVKYCLDYEDEYDVISFVAANDAELLRLEIRELHKKLSNSNIVTKPEQPAKDEIIDFFEMLKSINSWLLVFDDAAQLTVLAQYLPQKLTGHIIITSRSPNWRAIAKAIKVDPLQQTEAATFLMKRTSDMDRTSARLLARRLAGLHWPSIRLPDILSNPAFLCAVIFIFLIDITTRFSEWGVRPPITLIRLQRPGALVSKKFKKHRQQPRT